MGSNSYIIRFNAVPEYMPWTNYPTYVMYRFLSEKSQLQATRAMLADHEDNVEAAEALRKMCVDAIPVSPGLYHALLDFALDYVDWGAVVTVLRCE